MGRKQADGMPGGTKRVAGLYYFMPGSRGRDAGWDSCIALGRDQEIARAEATRLGQLLAIGALGRDAVVQQMLKNMLHRAKGRAKQTGRPFDLDLEYLQELASNSKGRCAVTGIVFSLQRCGGRSGPWNVSLDRIKSSEGYTKANVRLVCHAVNVAMNEWGIEVLERIVSATKRPSSEKTQKRARFGNFSHSVSP